MNMQDFTSKVANTICSAFNDATRDLPVNATNREKQIVENCFFEMVVAYKMILSNTDYESLCTKIELVGGRRYCYRPTL